MMVAKMNDVGIRKESLLPVSGKKVLVVPLDWGLGHATRCIPVIYDLLNSGCEVIIGGSGLSLTLLRKEFPELKHVLIRGSKVRIGVRGIQIFQFFRHLYFFLRFVEKEHKSLEKIIDEISPEVIISDNRYGLWTNRAHCILITHQLRPIFPRYLFWFSPFARRQILRWAGRFDEIWIPDEAGQNNLTGILNWGVSIKGAVIRHIGLLSRFQQLEPEKIDPDLIPVPDILAMTSGPEPQRKRFEKLLIRKLSDLPYRSVILQGIPSASEIIKAASNVWLVSHLSSRQMLYLMKEASLIIARGGYSTIMDLRVLEKKAVLVPTPGQPEQEYLCSRMQQLGYFTCIKQSEFGNIKILLTEKCRDRNSIEEKT
ncbi:MAG: glycosyltransferase [Bacteroidales bacterium]